MNLIVFLSLFPFFFLLKQISITIGPHIMIKFIIVSMLYISLMVERAASTHETRKNGTQEKKKKQKWKPRSIFSDKHVLSRFYGNWIRHFSGHHSYIAYLFAQWSHTICSLSYASIRINGSSFGIRCRLIHMTDGPSKATIMPIYFYFDVIINFYNARLHFIKFVNTCNEDSGSNNISIQLMIKYI